MDEITSKSNNLTSKLNSNLQGWNSQIEWIGNGEYKQERWYDIEG